jgi:acetyl esterase/lipase
MPKIPSFAEYDSATQLRETILAQFMQMYAAGIIVPTDWTGYSKTDISIPTRDGAELRGVVYKPAEETAAKGGLLVYFHGGGWTFGMPEAGERWFEPLVKELGMCCVSVGYRVAPENVFPAAAHDAIDALRWVSLIPWWRVSRNSL